MIVTATWTQFLDIVKAENNPQILYTVDKDGRPLNVHVRSWGGIIFTLLEAPFEVMCRETFSYARKVESLDA